MIGNVAFIILVLAVLVLTLLSGWLRQLALVPTLYLTGFVWENRLVDRAEHHAPDPDRRDPDRAHERAAAGAAREPRVEIV